MDKTKVKNKRTVPIRYQQSQLSKYQSSPKKNDSKKENQRKIESEINDNQQNYDNQSNQEYMQSSYKQKYSQKNVKISYDGDSYYEEDLIEQQDQQYVYDQNQKIQKKQSMNHYELTFKKNMQQNEEQQISYNESSKMYNYQKQADNDFQDESQSFEQVQYDMNQINDIKKCRNQYSNIDQLIENHEKLYQKYHSALVNFYYLHTKPTKTIEQKHKEYLLSLLVQQLQKNIFINGLKLNYHRVKAKKQSQQEQVLVIQQTKPKLQLSIKPSQKQNPIKLKQSKVKSKEKENKKSLDQSYLQQIQAKLLIFQQITYGIMRKKLFQCFDCIVTKSKLNVQRKYQESHERKNNNSVGEYQVSDQELDDQQVSQSQDVYQSLKSQRRNKIGEKSHFTSQQDSNSLFQNKQKSSQKSNKSKSKQPSSSKSKIHELQAYNHSNSNDLENYQQQEQQQEQEQVQQNSQQEQVSQNNGSFQQEDEDYRKLQELIHYIHSLKNEALQTDSQLKRYFLKWKIYMLELILEEYHQQEQNDQQNEDEEQENSQLQKSQQKEQQPSYVESQRNIIQQIYSSKKSKQSAGKKQSREDYRHQQVKNKKNPVKSSQNQLTQRNESSHRSVHKISKISHNSSNHLDNSQLSNQSYSIKLNASEDSIQEKTLILKSFLYENYLNEFWNHFSQFSTHKKLMIVSQKLREQNLKKNALFGLQINIQWRQKQRAMIEYYQQIAQSQDLSQLRSADLFYRTNLKTKYFFQFTKICQQLKCFKKLDSLTTKIYFLKIYNYADFIKRKQFNIQRFFLTQRNKRLFKSFRAWKESTILSPNYQKIKTFNQRKDSQTLAQYFSILQIFYKQSLIQQKKAINFYKAKQTQKVFKYLDFLSKQSRQNKVKQRQLRQYLVFSKGKQFYDSFYQFYGQKVLQHRMKIRAQKIFYSRQKEFIYERLQQWRNFVIKKQSYQAIQYRLVKLRQKQVKQNVFNIWLDELDKRQNKKDELQQSAQHKDWLVKYYGSLCEIATSGKMTN